MARQFADLIDELEINAEELNSAQCWLVKRACGLTREIVEPTISEREQGCSYLDEARVVLSCRLFYKLADGTCPGCYLEWNCHLLAKAARVV